MRIGPSQHCGFYMWGDGASTPGEAAVLPTAFIEQLANLSTSASSGLKKAKLPLFFGTEKTL